MIEERKDKEFTRCPVCGSEERFMESLAQKVIKQGIASKDWRLFYDVRHGVAIDPERTIIMPVGLRVPAYFVATDICMNCGTIYAVIISEGEARLETRNMPGNPPTGGNPKN
jgi:uncharacterized Zn finger protein